MLGPWQGVAIDGFSVVERDGNVSPWTHPR
jgi:hypothetical protein